MYLSLSLSFSLSLYIYIYTHTCVETEASADDGGSPRSKTLLHNKYNSTYNTNTVNEYNARAHKKQANKQTNKQTQANTTHKAQQGPRRCCPRARCATWTWSSRWTATT